MHRSTAAHQGLGTEAAQRLESYSAVPFKCFSVDRHAGPDLCYSNSPPHPPVVCHSLTGPGRLPCSLPASPDVCIPRPVGPTAGHSSAQQGLSLFNSVLFNSVLGHLLSASIVGDCSWEQNRGLELSSHCEAPRFLLVPELKGNAPSFTG